MSIRSGIRKLPFPLTSHFTREVVKKIMEIPNDEIKYTDEEIQWMQRAVENLDYMIKTESSCGIDTSVMEKRKSQIEETLELCKKSYSTEIG